MIFFRACRRCRGDMYLERGFYEEYKKCLQCGYIVYLTEAELKKLSQVDAKAA